MKNLIVVLSGVFLLNSSCLAQKEIVYDFDNCVIDSIQQGIKLYSRMLHKPANALKLCAVVSMDDNEYHIFLQEYSSLPESGLLSVIRNTNRKIKAAGVDIPVIIPADIMSGQIRKDNIAAIPLGGYFLKVVYENYKQKVVLTSVAF